MAQSIGFHQICCLDIIFLNNWMKLPNLFLVKCQKGQRKENKQMLCIIGLKNAFFLAVILENTQNLTQP